MNVTAIVIARGGSQRLPGKNMRMFFGRPLVAHKVWQLKQCRAVSRVIVGSDSPEILAVAQSAGADMVRKRLPEMCDEVSRSWNEVIYDMVSMVPGEVILWAHCTNPCIQPKTYDRAVAHFLSEDCDSVVGVHALQTHIWYQHAPLNFDPRAVPHQVASKLEPVFVQNGGIFVASTHDMLKWSYVYGTKPYLFGYDADEATDIDTQHDWDRAVGVYPRCEQRGLRP